MTDAYDGANDDRDAYDRDGADDGDALEHLWNAAHEMLSAMRMVLDAADEFVASQRGPRPNPSRRTGAGDERAGRVRHIDIDLDADARHAPDPGAERA